MNTRRTMVVALLACLALPVVATTQQNNGDVMVTSTIRDYVDVVDGTGATQRIPMQIQSDGAGPYTDIAYKGDKKVTSIIQGIGDWELDTGVSIRYPTRQGFVDFSKPVFGSGPNGADPTPPFTTALVRPRFIEKCHEYNNSMFTLPYQSTMVCPVFIAFDYNSQRYRMDMNPISTAQGYHPETDFLNVTCTGMNASSQCNSWLIEPNGTKGGCATADCSVKQNVVKLVKVVTVKGKTTNIDQGDFYMSFSIVLTNP